MRFISYNYHVCKGVRKNLMKLEVKELRKSFGDKEVLHGISFSIESGKALGLLGRNGAGKTTTIRILMDVFRANSGSITVDGRPFHPRNFRIGYLPEERGLYPKKGVQEQLMYLAQLRGSSRADAKEQSMRWLKRLGVEEYAQRKLETLSKGNQQKVQLAQTLVCDPELVILDEPFSGLDPVNSQILKDVIQEQIEEGKLVIFSSHQMSYVEEFCEDIVLINHGDLVTRYQHCSAIFVKTGQSVSAGDNIAAVGTTGISTGAHLHFEVLVGGSPVNPRNYLSL